MAEPLLLPLLQWLSSWWQRQRRNEDSGAPPVSMDGCLNDAVEMGEEKRPVLR